MIYDLIENLKFYRALAPATIDKLAEFCIGLNKDTPLGRHELDGKLMYANVRRMNTHEADPDKLEIHQEHLDLHLVTAGGETVYFRPVAGLEVTRAYEPEQDLAFYRSEPVDETAFLLIPGHFVIFFPGEGHRPDCGPAQNEVTKVMIKIHRSLLDCI